jgi:hypothetical protein
LFLEHAAHFLTLKFGVAVNGGRDSVVTHLSVLANPLLATALHVQHFLLTALLFSAEGVLAVRRPYIVLLRLLVVGACETAALRRRRTALLARTPGSAATLSENLVLPDPPALELALGVVVTVEVATVRLLRAAL